MKKLFRVYDRLNKEYLHKDNNPLIFTIDDLQEGLIFKPNTCDIEQATPFKNDSKERVFEGDIVKYRDIKYAIKTRDGIGLVCEIIDEEDQFLYLENTENEEVPTVAEICKHGKIVGTIHDKE